MKRLVVSMLLVIFSVIGGTILIPLISADQPSAGPFRRDLPSPVSIAVSVQPRRPGPLPAVAPQFVLHGTLLSLDEQRLKDVEIELDDFLTKAQRDSISAFPAGWKLTQPVFNPREAELIGKLLISSGGAKVVARPSLVVTAGRTATFTPGGEFPTIALRNVGTVAVELGTTVEITPKLVSGDTKLQLDVSIRHSVVDDKRQVNVNGKNVPQLSSSVRQTLVELEPGQTVIVRGPDGANLVLIITPEFATSGSSQARMGPATDEAAGDEKASQATAGPPPLDVVLKDLFPDAEITVVPLANSVVLRGRIDSRLAGTAIEVAEDYYPSVINLLQLSKSPPRPAAPPKATRPRTPSSPNSTQFTREIRELREEVQVLRRDVSRLIELLEDESARPNSDAAADAGASEDGLKPGDEISSYVQPVSDEYVWERLGIRIKPTEVETGRYRGGLRVLAVRSGSPAWQKEFREGDILVGLGKWETTERENLDYVLGMVEPEHDATLKFYVVRGGEALYGTMTLPAVPKSDDASETTPRRTEKISMNRTCGFTSDLPPPTGV